MLRETTIGEFKNDVEDARYMLLPSVPNRTTDLSVLVELLQDGIGQPANIEVGAWSIGLEWDENVKRNMRVKLKASYRGELPVALRKGPIWITLGQILVGEGKERTLKEALSFMESSLLEGALEKEVKPVPGVPNSKPYREFFREYDYATNPKLFAKNPNLTKADKTERCTAVNSVGTLLWNRVRHRYDTNTEPYDDPNFKQDHESLVSDDTVVYLSKLQRPIFETHFGDTSTPPVMDWVHVDEAFDFFASGNLMDYKQIFNYMPDGENVFLFAEFALLAVDRGVDAEFWQNVVTVFIRAQELYLATYGKIPPAISLPEMEIVKTPYQAFLPQDLDNKHEANIQAGYAIPMESNPLCDFAT